MASTINGTSTGNGGLISTGDDSGILNIQTNETTAITVDASQNVGIGTTSPTAKLDIRGGVFVIPSAGWSSGNTATINLGDSGNGWSSPYGLINNLSAYNGLAFSTGNSERMRIDSSGNLLVGATSNSSSTSTPKVFIAAGSSASTTIQAMPCGTIMNNSVNTGSSGYGVSLKFLMSAGEPGKYAAIAGIGDSNYANSTALAFYTNPNGVNGADNNVERMRINSSGVVMVGTTTTTPAGSGDTKGISLWTDGSSSQIFSTGNGDTAAVFNRAGSDGALIRTRRQGSDVGSISVTASATAYNTSSDYRLKDNVQPMTGALAKVALLKPVTFKWKIDGSDSEGFIAHELQAIKPDCVSGDKDAVDADGNPQYQGIDTSFLVATLTAALQETKALIDTQAETLTQQTEAINALTARIVALEAA